MHLKWEDAVQRFLISKLHQQASLDILPEKMQPFFKEWINSNKKNSLFLSGNPGSGKTFAMIALLKALINQEKYNWIILIRSDELDDELLRAIENKQEATVLEKYYEVPFLFWDDLGVERTNDRVLKQYYSIIDRRLNNLLPTVFTSNYSRENIGKNVGDRIGSRLQMTTETIFPNKDYRKEMS